MNSKSFRRNHGPKPKSTSSTFISLHFNKSDEDQLEISYKNDKKEEEDTTNADVPQSNFYVTNTKSSSDNLSNAFSAEEAVSRNRKSPESVVDSALKISKSSENKLSFMKSSDDILEENKSSKVIKNFSQYAVEKKSDEKQDVDLQTNIAADLSPAVEAAEIVNSDTFHRYINNELEKAKSEMLDLKKETQSSSMSEKPTINPFFSQDLSSGSKITKTSHQHKTDQVDGNQLPLKSGSYFTSILQNGIKLMKFAQNSVKFHIFFAVFAFACAPIPSWLSGFLVGSLLSSSFVYWLYKPQKSKRSFYPFNYVSPAIVSHFQEESGILKGWMNELPTCMNYSPERYHVSCTRSVYVRLEGSYVRFSFPQKNIPKRAMFNEPRYEMQFIHQQHYDITDATIELLPQGLNHKRLWSKKYPICLRIPNHKGAVLSKGSDAEGSFSARGNKKENSSKKFTPRINESNEIVIYLFSRTDRDKSLWFSRFLKASRVKVGRPHSPNLCTQMPEQDSLESKRTLSVDFASLQSSFSEEQEEDETEDTFVKLSLSKQQKFEMYMSSLLAPLYAEHPFGTTKKDKDKKEMRNPSSLTWLNVLIGRLFFDFLVEDVWAQLVSAKIQRKLNRIKLPFFLSELTVKDIHLGSALPKVHNTSDPCMDERGLWIDLDISYNGSFHMTLETKLNLSRFKPDSETLFTEEQAKSSLCNSDEDSLESSSDEDYPSLENDKDKEGSGSRSKKLLKFVDKLAQSSYFQHAAKTKFVKRAMDEMSNTPLVLTVEVQWLTGTLAINIPPWPTDRLWYGFRSNPSLSITARPKLGQHVVTFTQVTEWIEKKLTSEFQKVLVMPNMDDLIIPIMLPNQDVVSWISKGSALFI